jgi:hypothetical protein
MSKKNIYIIAGIVIVGAVIYFSTKPKNVIEADGYKIRIN